MTKAEIQENESGSLPISSEKVFCF
jgi:hypothetical protein